MRRDKLALLTAGSMVAAFCAAASGGAQAQTPQAQTPQAQTPQAQTLQAPPASPNAVPPIAVAPITVPDVDVVGSTPLLGSGLNRDQVPAATNVLGSTDIVRTNIPSLTGAILDNIPSASLNDVEGNPFQPDILYRGFIASPVAGTNEGLAVYVNGARFNDAFGDTVNWDLIPGIAISTVNVEASNPVFGLNALGGSVNVQLKNGFDFHGGDLTAYGGSYGRGAGSLEYGQQVGNFAIYAAGEVINDNGFRDTEASQIYRLYTDLGWRNDIAEIHINVTAADNTLGNPGASPVQELDAKLNYVPTAPNEVYNKYVAVNVNGSVAVNDTTTLQGVAYFQNLTQRVPNGTTVDVFNCGATAPGLLCNDDGSVVTGRNGVPVPAFEANGVYSGLSTQALDSHYYGASAQVTNDGDLFGLKNHVVAGASFDGSDSIFSGRNAIGGFDPYTNEYLGPGYVQDQPDEGINPVRVVSTTRYYGVFGQDILTIAPKLDLSLAGRFNDAETDLHDKLGGPVTGQHSYNRFNPSAGLTYRLLPELQLYGSYSETNRVPTPQELSCASAANPCTLLSFFVGDPNLKQVVSRTFELGARGSIADVMGGKLGWNADYFHTKDHDDLIYETVNTLLGYAYYTNAGQTLRQGVEANVHYDTAALHAVLGYAFTDATFQSPLLLGSDANPGSDANGNIHVVPGDRIPNIPRHRGTVLVDYKLTDRWTVGGNVILQSAQYRVGDEANLAKPVGGYVLVNLHSSYRITDAVTVFGVLNNAFDQRYATYGSFADFSSLPFPLVPGGVTDTRTASPGMPIAAYGGVKVAF
jgi:outer membrane receptor protein involved in Fe transport